jgi:hypothetical protein
MQVQTTITTTETIPVSNNFFKITTYEMTISAFCDCCINQASGTKTELENAGWSFGTGSEFCSECN